MGQHRGHCDRKQPYGHVDHSDRESLSDDAGRNARKPRSHNLDEFNARRGRAAGDEAWANNASFGALLRAWRQRGSLTQERLADRSGLSARTIRELEAGRVGRPRNDSIRLLADALQLARSERERFEETARGPRSTSLSRMQGASARRSTAPFQLPTSVADFAGQVEPTCRHRGRVPCRADGTAIEFAETVVIISAIVGMARVGESALARHVVHHPAAGFPNGRPFAKPRGTSGDGRRLDPLEVLSWLLRAVGVDSGAIASGI